MKVAIAIAILIMGMLFGFFIVGFTPAGMMVYQSKDKLDPDDLAMVPYLDTEGFSEVAVDVDENRIYLYSGCRRLVMITNEFQTESIKDGLEGKMDFRPNSHDAIKSIMETFEMETLMVKITHLEEGAYFARIFLLQDTRILNLDIRPTDAIAIAARTGAPVYVNQELMEEQGEIIC